MKWLRLKFRRKRPKRISRLDRQLKMGLLEDAMGRVERQRDPRRVRPDEDRQISFRPVGPPRGWARPITELGRL